MLRRHAQPRPAATRQSPARRRAARFATSRHLTPAAGRADSGRLVAAATAAPPQPGGLSGLPAADQIAAPARCAATASLAASHRASALAAGELVASDEFAMSPQFTTALRSVPRLVWPPQPVWLTASACSTARPRALAAPRGPLAAVASCAAAASLATAQAHRPTYGQMPCAMGDSVGTDGQSLLCGWSQAAVSHGRCPV